MTYGLWLSAAGLQTNQYRQAVLANNLANVNTVGFKHDLAVVRERAIEVREDGDMRFAHPMLDGLSGGSVVAPTYTTFAQGPIEQTGGKLDVAIRGKGFFAVRDGVETRYTRDGRFTTDAAGRLVTVAGGKPVLDDAGQEIIVSLANGAKAEITVSGGVRQGGGDDIAQLGLYHVDDPQRLRKVGGNLFDANGAEMIEGDATLEVGAVENSTVSPVQAMASMIEVARAYQLNATMITLQDELNGRAVSSIGDLG